MTAAVQEVKKVGKGVLDNRYDEHRVVIERGYQAEQLKVAAANQNPPERRAAADAQMNLILARMKVSLDSMRSEKEACAGPDIKDLVAGEGLEPPTPGL